MIREKAARFPKGGRACLRIRGQAPPASAGERNQTAFPKGQVRPFAASDNHVVQNLDVEDLTRLHELASDADVFGGRCAVPGRMIMGQNDGASPGFDGSSEDFAWVHEGSVSDAEGD